jgi:hypothetical protein
MIKKVYLGVIADGDVEELAEAHGDGEVVGVPLVEGQHGREDAGQLRLELLRREDRAHGAHGLNRRRADLQERVPERRATSSMTSATPLRTNIFKKNTIHSTLDSLEGSQFVKMIS